MGLGLNFYLVNTRKYENDLLPAYRAFIERGERTSLRSILRQAVVQADKAEPSWPGFLDSPAIGEEFGAILDGEKYYSATGGAPANGSRKSSEEDLQFFVKNLLVPSLLASVCVVSTSEFKPWQDLHGRRELTDYLYAQSRWIEDRLTFAREFHGEQPEIVIGEWGLFLADADLKTLDQELSGMPPPTATAVEPDFENLRAMCRAALNGSARILACIL